MQVEIWADVVCPWCYLGTRHFEQALERFPHRDDVEVIHLVNSPSPLPGTPGGWCSRLLQPNTR